MCVCGGGEWGGAPADQSVIREFEDILKYNLIFHLLKCYTFRLTYLKIMIIKMPTHNPTIHFRRCFPLYNKISRFISLLPLLKNKYKMVQILSWIEILTIGE